LLFGDVTDIEKVLIGLNWLWMIWLQIWSKNNNFGTPTGKITQTVPGIHNANMTIFGCKSYQFF